MTWHATETVGKALDDNWRCYSPPRATIRLPWPPLPLLSAAPSVHLTPGVEFYSYLLRIVPLHGGTKLQNGVSDEES